MGFDSQITNQITAPVFKSITALGAGAGSSIAAIVAKSHTFLPHDAAGWMALIASTVAVGYTLTLWAEWWWKKFWRDFLKRRGILKPKRRNYRSAS